MFLKYFVLAAAALAKVRPQDDFYLNINEDWIASHPIPADRQSVGGMGDIAVEVEGQIKSIFEGLLKKPEGESLAAEMYTSGMDESALEKAGLSPIKPLVDQIMAPETDLESMIHLIQSKGFSSGLIDVTAFHNQFNTSQTVLGVGESDLTLPEKSYYSDKEYEEIRGQTVVAIANLLNASSYPGGDYNGAAKSVFEFETRLANISLSKEKLDESLTVPNMVPFSNIMALTPTFNWDTYLAKFGLNATKEVYAPNSEYLKYAFQIIQGTDPSTLKLYFYYKLVKATAPFLNKRMVEANFAFQTIQTGLNTQPPREKVVAGMVSSILRDEISKLYVASHFPPEEKKAALEMIQVIIESFRERISKNTWMSPTTKEKALLKLNNMKVKIGYPDQWRDYSPLNGKISRKNSYFDNIVAASAFEFARKISTIGKDREQWQWELAAFTVNAYNKPSANEIVFPAAILQEPTLYPPTAYEPLGKPAINFGRAGSVIAHEISHSFDSSGRKFDQFGNLVDWWTEQDSKAFQAKADALINQFNQYEVHGAKVNGKLTGAENIADLAGGIAAFDAFEKYLAAHPELPEMVDGYTQRQRFFVALAEYYRSNKRKELALNLLKNDNHSPGMFRVNGPFSHHAGFYKAFNVTQGDKLFRPEAERIVFY